MKAMVLGLFALVTAFPAAAQQMAECRSIGGHHYYNDRISAARYVWLSGSKMELAGRTGRQDMPHWFLRCSPTESGMFCSGRSRGKVVNIQTDGWKMKEMVYDRRHGVEAFHVVYNCNHQLVLP